MHRNALGLSAGLVLALVALLVAGPAGQLTLAAGEDDGAGKLRIGWASADLTPEKPVVLTGFSRARVSEGVLDPITATALAIEAVEGDDATGKVVMVSVPR